MKKICIRCKKEGRWINEMCGRCISIIREKELTKSPYIAVRAEEIVGAGRRVAVGNSKC